MNDEFDPKDIGEDSDLAEHDDLLGGDLAGGADLDGDDVEEDDYDGETYE